MKTPDTPDKTSIENIAGLPKGIVIASAWSWRLLVIFAALAVILFIGSRISEVLIPFAVALLIGALLVPIVNSLKRKGWPKPLAIITSLLGVIIVIGGLGFLTVTQVRTALPNLETRSIEAFNAAKGFLTSPEIGFTQADINNAGQDILKYVQENSQTFTAGLSSAGSAIGHIVVGSLLVIFTLIFVLIDGKQMWKWFVGLLPRRARAAVNGSGEVSWTALSHFVKSQVMVAAVDAVGIGLGAFILGVPLAIPIAVLVFFASFIPVVGAIFAGIIAVALALIFNGWVVALIMLGVVILVQQIEGHLLQPFLVGKAVSIHPLAIVLSVAIGTILAGIPGALFAVPVVAVLSKSVTYISRRGWEEKTDSKAS